MYNRELETSKQKHAEHIRNLKANAASRIKSKKKKNKSKE
jgi:hypothetical protein